MWRLQHGQSVTESPTTPNPERDVGPSARFTRIRPNVACPATGQQLHPIGVRAGVESSAHVEGILQEAPGFRVCAFMPALAARARVSAVRTTLGNRKAHGALCRTRSRRLAQIRSEIVHVDVHVVPPHEERPYWFLFTTGMSALPMRVPDSMGLVPHAELSLMLPAWWQVDLEHWKREPRCSGRFESWLDLVGSHGIRHVGEGTHGCAR